MTRTRFLRFLRYVVLLFLGLVFAMPFLWTVSTSFKELSETTRFPPEWIPRSDLYQLKEPAATFFPIADQAESIQPNRYLVQWTTPENHVAPSGILNTQTIAWIRPIGSSLPYRAVPSDSVELIGRKVHFHWDNYLQAVTKIPFWRYAKNTLWLCTLTVVGITFSSAVVAYGFARIKWRGRDTLFMFVLATMMIPFPVTLIPLYSVFRELGLIGTMVPLWLPAFFGHAFFIFLLRQFFRTIPQDLSDAARIDGCSEWQIFWRIILPLSHSALTVVAIFQFIDCWNDFLGPFIYLTDQDQFTLSLGLQFFQSRHGGTDWHYLMAASTLVTTPVIALFFLAQRRFIEGITMTGLKN